MNFTFEYSSKYCQSIREIDRTIEITLNSSVSTIFVDIVDVTQDTTALSFHQSLPDEIKRLEENFDFIDNVVILKQDTIILNGVSGYNFEIKYDDKQKSALNGNTFRAYDRYVVVQRNEKVYALRLFVKASETDTIKDFQYLLDTWKWK